jgi:DNA-directed RNA polymerase specialized sigma24 family protein
MADLSKDESTHVLLASLVALLVDEREARLRSQPSEMRTEVLLADAGLPIATIARLMGKNPDAVRKAISRARQRGGQKADDTDA